jgi:hypothetical protein
MMTTAPAKIPLSLAPLCSYQNNQEHDVGANASLTIAILKPLITQKSIFTCPPKPLFATRTKM